MHKPSFIDSTPQSCVDSHQVCDDQSPDPMGADSATFPFVWECRVYWEDTDAGGVVYHANYLKFMERARTEWLRSLGLQQSTMVQSYGGVFVVRRCEVDYLRPASLDDRLSVVTQLSQPYAKGASLFLQQRITANGQEVCAAVVHIVWVDAQAWRPKKIPTQVVAMMAISND